jgi:hypothetical protein
MRTESVLRRWGSMMRSVFIRRWGSQLSPINLYNIHSKPIFHTHCKHPHQDKSYIAKVRLIRRQTLGHVSPTPHVSESKVDLRESRGSTTLCWKGAKHHPEKKEKATQHYLEKQKKATQHHAEKQHTTQHSASGWWREKLFKLAPSLMSSS